MVAIQIGFSIGPCFAITSKRYTVTDLSALNFQPAPGRNGSINDHGDVIGTLAPSQGLAILRDGVPTLIPELAGYSPEAINNFGQILVGSINGSCFGRRTHRMG